MKAKMSIEAGVVQDDKTSTLYPFFSLKCKSYISDKDKERAVKNREQENKEAQDSI